MKNTFVFGAILGMLIAIIPAGPSFGQEKLTLTTYYPSPFGVYDRLRLTPRASLSAEEFCASVKDVGLMYYDDGSDEKRAGLYICTKLDEDEYDWVQVTRPLVFEGGVPMPGTVTCVKEDGTLGRCINNPSYDGSCGCL